MPARMANEDVEPLDSEEETRRKELMELAAALMRAKGIACRSVAVVPPIGQRLEMHRIAEYHDGERWVAFDPSSLQTDVPARPWQNVVMARTTPADERAGTSLTRPSV